jgi:hypothetical protein
MSALADDVSRLVDRELHRAQRELMDKAKQAGMGASMLGGAGVLAALATGSSAVWALRCLDRHLPPRLAALVLTGCYGAAAAGLGAAGFTMVRQAWAEGTERAAQGMRQDVAAVAAPKSTPETR